MTISSQSNRNNYTGNGTTAVYNYTFRVFSETDFDIIIRDAVGVETSIDLTTDYTVDGVGTSGGNITLVSDSQEWIDGNGFLADGYVLAILRQVDLKQLTDIRNQGDFYPEIHEDQFDKLTMIDQQQQDDLDRSIRLPKSIESSSFDTEMPAAIVGSTGLALVTNENGDGFAVGPSVGSIEGANDSAIAAAASAAEAVVSAGEASDSAVLTAADVLLTNADVVSANADVVLTNADVVQTGLDVISTHADVVSTALSETNASDSETAAALSASDAAASAAASGWVDVEFKTFADSPITVTDGDSGNLFAIDCSGGNVVVNLLSISAVTFPWRTGFKKTDISGNTITINADGTDTIDGGTDVVVSRASAGTTIIPDVDPVPDEWTSLSFGEVPIEGSIVGTTDAQRLTNKEIVLKTDTTSNLETYASSATDGELLFSSDDQSYHGVVDSELVDLGGGGTGVGDTSVYKSIDGDAIEVADWDTTAQAGATFEDNEVTPLAGDSSYNYETDTDSGAEVSLDFPVPRRSQSDQSSTHKIQFPFIQTGTEGAIQLEIYDKTNTAVIKTIDLLNKNSRFTGSFTIPSGCEELTFKIKSITDDVAGLEIDQIVFSDKFGEYGSITETQTYLISQPGDDLTDRDNETQFNLATASITTDNPDIVYEIDDPANNRTKWISKKNTSLIITYTATTDTAGRNTCVTKNGVIVQGGSNSNDADQSSVATVHINLESGEFFTVGVTRNDESFNNDGVRNVAASAYMSFTATATTDQVQFEDSYMQGHFVGKAIYNLSGAYTTASSSYVLPSLSLTSSTLSGILEQNTASAPSITVPSARRGTYVVTVTGFTGYDAATAMLFSIYDGTTYHSEQAVSVGYVPAMTFAIEHNSDDSLDLDFMMKTSGSQINILPNTPLEISVSYLPPVDQAKTTRILSVNSSLENDFDVDASSTGVLSNFNGASDWCELVSHSTGIYDYKLNESIFTSGNFPALWTQSTQSQVRIPSILKGTFPYFRITYANEVPSAQDSSHIIRAKKRGADRSDRHTPVVNGDDVVFANHKTTEFDTGETWIDGRTIWGRSFDQLEATTADTLSTLVTLDTNLLVLNIEGLMLASDNVSWYSFPSSGGGGHDSFMKYVTTTGIISVYNSGLSSVRQVFTVRYLK